MTGTEWNTTEEKIQQDTGTQSNTSKIAVRPPSGYGLYQSGNLIKLYYRYFLPKRNKNNSGDSF